jgi:hypothetical protein
MDVERAIKYVSLVNAALWAALLTLWVVGAARSLHPAEVGGMPLFPPPVQIESVARAVVGALYAVFKWVCIAGVILLGIQSVLGLSGTVLRFVGISVPRGGLNSMIQGVLQILLIKLIVDAALRYLGYTPAEILALEAALFATWLGVLTLTVAIAVAAYLVWRLFTLRLEIRLR